MGAKVIDPNLYKAAGVDPKTKKPDRVAEIALKEQFRKIFRIIDEQDAVNRYKWYNLPMDLSSEEVERLLYYKGQLCFFYFKELEKFFILPYALDGEIDFYGRYNHVHPVPFASGKDDNLSKEDAARAEQQRAILSTLKLKVIKEPLLEEEVSLEDFEGGCVLLHDYTKQLSQTIISRQALNECFIDLESDILPYLSTALLAGTGIKGMRVNDADAAGEAERASKQVKHSALTQKLYNAMTSSVEFQELSDGSPLKTEEFLLALQGVENIRKGSLGIENGGIFQKKAHKLESEQTGNESSVATVFQDGLSIRQRFCNIVNSVWGTEMWCEPAESMVNVDLNADGVMYNRDGEQPPAAEEQPAQEGAKNNE
ncbi:MAG: hypothetical protein J6S85_06560 [Methanobrevibacter sp.]|nr:hypothetical protein [Methanobrevibacter sp.]